MEHVSSLTPKKLMVPVRSQRLAAKRSSPLRSGIVRRGVDDKNCRQNNRWQKESLRKSKSKQIGSKEEKTSNNGECLEGNPASNVLENTVDIERVDDEDEEILEDNGSKKSIIGNGEAVIVSKNVYVDNSKDKIEKQVLSTVKRICLIHVYQKTTNLEDPMKVSRRP